MDSVIPFQDLNLNLNLNLYPGGPTTSTPKLVPKIEPKTEPFDEPPPTQFLSPSDFPNPTSTLTPQPNPEPIGGEIPNSDVYSDYSRITELFRTAFAARMHGDGVVLEDPDSRAIVPVVNDETQLSNVVVAKKKYTPRSSELVRVTDLKPEDDRYFRDVVRRTRMVFDSLRICSLLEDEKNRQMGNFRKSRGDLKAAQMMRERGLWLNRDKRIVGAIPGVEIGDLFFFRIELCVVGLHGHIQAGIDYVSAHSSSSGEPIATSVIVSGGYEDDEDAGDVIIYTGHGGQDLNGKQYMHQRLESGNLALERSMHYGIEVRVIRGLKYEGSASGKVYVYDGLYRIVSCWFDVGKSGFGVFKFRLVRIENQPEMGSSILRFAVTLRTRPLEVRPTGYLSFDISRKRENVPVFLYNDIDNHHDPATYQYLVKTIFPSFVYQMGSTTGCECVGGCYGGCLCEMKNGGQFAYDQSGILFRGKPVIFECGPHCKCPPTCRNRVTQRGLRNRFEVFRSKETGWGVRSLDLIQAGSFICEFTGLVLTREQAEIVAMNGDSLVHPGRFSERWTEWGDLSQIYSDYVRPSHPSVPPLDFALDVSEIRNVACYISHSSSPNVLVQFVLYDHNNLSFPHLMLFAMENIPPLRELSIDYGVADESTGKLAICN